MNTRSKDRFDYKVFDETGIKVLISGVENLNIKMDTKEVVDELKIIGDIKHWVNMFSTT